MAGSAATDCAAAKRARAERRVDGKSMMMIDLKENEKESFEFGWIETDLM